MAGVPPPSYQESSQYPQGQQGTAQPLLGTNPNTGAAYPPQAGGYPPPTGAYPPPQPGFAPPPAAYAPPQGYAAQPGYGPQPAVYPPTGYSTNPEEPKVEENTNFWDDAAGSSFSDKTIRMRFIRKVFAILSAQLATTLAFVCFFLFHTPTKLWVQSNSWFYYVSYATFLVTYITLVCCPKVRRKWPANFICLVIFTLAFTYMTATITTYYETTIVMIALGITFAVCFSIMLFAIQTKFDFTMCSGLIFALCMVVFFFGWAVLITYLVTGTSNYILNCVYGALAALLFSLFLAYDTQMVVGGRKHELSEEEYIYGALQLYLDIVYLFLIILSFFGGKSN